jgi:hypothetical protein
MNQDDPQQAWDNAGNCIFTNSSTYQITNIAGQYTPCMAKKTNFTNFAYQAMMTIDNGDSGGLIFRSDGAQNFYRLSLGSNGRYNLFACRANILLSITTLFISISMNGSLINGTRFPSRVR